jgi:hypothetical protein
VLGRHCPFLNREEEACAKHFKVGRLDYAFRHCMSNYDACPTYVILRDERRHRREETELTIHGRPHTKDSISPARPEAR